jgi:type I restriction enzyme S subunit
MNQSKQKNDNGIPEGWETLRLGGVCQKIGSGATPRGGSGVYISKGTSLIRSQNVYNNQFERNGLAFIGDEHAGQLENVTVEKGDVLLNITGDSVARVCQVPDNILPARVNQHVAIIRPRSEKLNPTYLRYYLVSPVMQSYMLGLASVGATRNALTKGMIESFEIPAPSLPEQRAIAKILSDLDAKIELNHQMNKTLESIASAIFKQWFVDFEFPGYEKTNFEGGLPRGWQEGCFGNISTISIGGDWGEDNKFEGAVQSISLRGTDLESLKSSGYAVNAPIRWIRKDKLDKRVINNRNILIGASGLGPIGKTIYCSEYLNSLYDFPVTYSNFCKCLTAETPAFALFAEMIMGNMYLSGEMNQFYIGTSIPNLDVNSLMKYPIVIPPQDMVQKFYDIVKQKFTKLFNQENILLTQIRDSLLPKLMLGKIRVN